MTACLPVYFIPWHKFKQPGQDPIVAKDYLYPQNQGLLCK